MPRMRTAPLVLTALLSLTATAAAEPKSFTALKGKYAADTNIIISADVTQIAKSPAFNTTLTAVLAEEEDMKQAFDAIKASCNIDVAASISDFTVVGSFSNDNALFVLGLNGIDQAKAQSCLETMLAADPDTKGAKVTAKKKGKVTAYAISGKTDVLYAAWLTKDVVALTNDPFEKGKLEKLLAGKAPKKDLKARLAAVTKTGPAFAAIAVKETEKDLGGTLLGGYGDVTLASGNIVANGHIVMSKPEEATALAGIFTTELGKARTEAKQLPELDKLLGGIKPAAAGSEVTFTVTASENDLVKLFSQLEKIF
jgi:hypothetical protein